MTRRFKLAINLIASTILFGWLAAQSTLPPLHALGDTPPAVQAKTATSFINSIGMNIHSYWWTANQTTNYINAVKDLHIHYIRDELAYSYNTYQQNNGFGSGWIERLQQFEQNGITSLVTANELIVSPSDVVNYVKLANHVPGTISLVEGPNEVDFQCAPSGTTFTGHIFVGCPTNLWQSRTENYVTAVKSALKADPATQNVTIYSPSIINPGGTNSTVFPAAADAGNLHYYPYLNAANSSTIAAELNQAAHLYGSKPVVVTEEGYPTQVGSGNRAVSEQIQAEVLPAYLLENYLAGVSRTYLYGLADVSSFSDYNGLISDTTGAKKPAFTALENLTTLLNDAGANFSPGQLHYQLTGQTDGLSSLLLQKNTGQFELVVWQKSLAESPTPLPGQTTTTSYIGVQFGDAITTVNEYRPTNSTDLVQSFSRPAALTGLSVGTSPLVLEITPTTASFGSGNSSTSSSSTGSKSLTKPKPIANPSRTSHGLQTNPVTATSSDLILPDVQKTTAPTWWQNVKDFFQVIGLWFIHLFRK